MKKKSNKDINSCFFVSGSSSDTQVETKKKGKIFVYEVSEHELYVLKKGTDGGIYLNLAIGLISTSISFIVNMLTSSFTSEFCKGVYVSICIGFFASGFILLLVYFAKKNDVKKVYKEIINR